MGSVCGSISCIKSPESFWAKGKKAVALWKIFAQPMCPVLDRTGMDAQAAIRSLWGLRMVGVQLVSIPSRDYASALFGSGRRFAVNAAEQRELGQLGRRISFR